jgi:hypothetical protein
MRTMRGRRTGATAILLVALVALAVPTGCAPSCERAREDDWPVLSGPYLGQAEPGGRPQLFAPGILSTGMYERDLAMAPGGDEFYWTLSVAGRSAIVGTRLVGGAWTEPEVVAFSRDPGFNEFEPFVTPDGQHLYFLSNRPRDGGALAPDEIGTWTHQNVWVADRLPDGGWSEARLPEAPIDTDDNEYFATVTQGGTIYFTRSPQGDLFSPAIHRCRLVDGRYAEVERLPDVVNCAAAHYNAFIAPDESYLILCIEGHPDNRGKADYYVAFRDPDDRWTAPVNLGPEINAPGRNGTSPYVSPDGRWFFFSYSRVAETEADPPTARRYRDLRRRWAGPQNGSSDVYWISADVIRRLRPAGS